MAKRVSISKQNQKQRNLDDLVEFIIVSGTIPENFDIDQIPQIRLGLRKRRRKAFLNKDNEALDKIDFALDYSVKLVHRKNLKPNNKILHTLSP